MPEKGYESISLPSQLLEEIRSFLREYPELGYSSIADFLKSAARARLQVDRFSILQSIISRDVAQNLVDLGGSGALSAEETKRMGRRLLDAFFSQSRCPRCQGFYSEDRSEPGRRRWRCASCGALTEVNPHQDLDLVHALIAEAVDRSRAAAGLEIVIHRDGIPAQGRRSVKGEPRPPGDVPKTKRKTAR